MSKQKQQKTERGSVNQLFVSKLLNELEYTFNDNFREDATQLFPELLFHTEYNEDIHRLSIKLSTVNGHDFVFEYTPSISIDSKQFMHSIQPIRSKLDELVQSRNFKPIKQAPTMYSRYLDRLTRYRRQEAEREANEWGVFFRSLSHKGK
jgi:hypothetical protein